MQWENLSKLMTIISGDFAKVGFLEMTMLKGKHSKIDI